MRFCHPLVCDFICYLNQPYFQWFIQLSWLSVAFVACFFSAISLNPVFAVLLSLILSYWFVASTSSVITPSVQHLSSKRITRIHLHLCTIHILISFFYFRNFLFTLFFVSFLSYFAAPRHFPNSSRPLLNRCEVNE